jgi:glycosyltransferase involved in cell wall biosynthesis
VISTILDATPLLGQRTGIGRYTEKLLTALAVRDDIDVGATAFTTRGWRSLPSEVPPGVHTRAVPVPARALRACWTRFEFPPVGLFGGRADVFHGTNFVLPPTGRAAGVLTIHDLAYLSNPDSVDVSSRALVELVPRGLRRAAAVCTPTAAVAELLRDAYGPQVPEVIVTPLGVDEQWFAATAPTPAERTSLDLPADYFLFIGTREPRKDLATLMAAYACLRDQSGDGIPDLVLIGPDGWGAQQEPAAGVRISGYLPQHELATVLAGARCLLMPSRDEGFGLPALEALACGTPVIVSDVPALLEVTGGQATAFPVGDVAALAALLAQVDTVEPPNAPGRRRRQDYARGWTWQACAEATMQAYRLAAG